MVFLPKGEIVRHYLIEWNSHLDSGDMVQLADQYKLLERGQVVRHQILILGIVGSNPTAPATFLLKSLT